MAIPDVQQDESGATPSRAVGTTPAEVLGGMLVSETVEDFESAEHQFPFRPEEMSGLVELALELAQNLKLNYRRR